MSLVLAGKVPEPAGTSHFRGRVAHEVTMSLFLIAKHQHDRFALTSSGRPNKHAINGGLNDKHLLHTALLAGSPTWVLGEGLLLV